jgi:hypothetical protein
VKAPARRNAAQDFCYYGFGHWRRGCGAGDKWRSGVEAPGRCAHQTPIWLKDQYVPNYQFKIGQQVSLRTAAQIKAPRGAYQIIQRFAARSGTLRYLIRSLEETEYRQIVDEADLAKY